MMFPEIRHVDDVLPHIGPGIKHIQRDGYSVLDYSYAAPDTFPNALALECRGLKFDAAGALIARPFQKFFNVGEREGIDQIAWSEPHTVFEKLDGSMVHGVMLGGKHVFMTRGGISPQARMAMERAPAAVLEASERLAREGMTAIFEFTSPDNKIVVEYSDDAVTLLAVRENVSGRYWSRAEVEGVGVPCAAAFDPVIDPAAFVDGARGLMGAEGFVIAFDNGHRLKIKADDYVFRHKALATIANERNVLRMVLDGSVDDVLPSLSLDLRKRVQAYSLDVERVIRRHAQSVSDFVDGHRQMPRKDFALTAKVEMAPRLLPATFRVLDGSDPHDAVSEVLSKSLRSAAALEDAKTDFPLVWSVDGIPAHELI